ncbi:MAG: HEAT repeat domain-containing protein, partial [Planctomycetaceae bacterium]
LFSAIGCVVLLRSRKAARIAALLLALSGVFAMTASTASAAQKTKKKPTTLQLIDQLKDPKKADAAAKLLIARGKSVIPDLIGEAVEGSDLAMRGWAIVCLAEIGGKEASDRLIEMQNDNKQPALVRTWAAAGRVKMANTTKELLELANLIGKYPALQRPIGIKLLARLKTKGKKVTAEELLTMSMRVRQLQQALAPAILNLGPDSLVEAMRTSKNQQVRRQAAGYLAAIANRGDEGVASAVVKAYKFDPKAKTVPWKGGPLFIPGLRWKKKDAQALVSGLIAWYVWTEENLDAGARRGVQQPIINNLNSIQLGAAAGYGRRFGRSVDTWLTVWGGVVGKAEIVKMLKAQKLEEKARYKRVLAQLK